MLRGDRLKDLRTSKDLTHAELAEKIAVHVRNIARWESGETDPDGDLVARLAVALDVSTDYLLGLTDDPRSSLRVDNLSPKERQVIAAMRRGEIEEVLKALVEK